MFHACSFMTYWVGLYNSELQGTLMVGVKAQLASLDNSELQGTLMVGVKALLACAQRATTPAMPRGY